MTTHLSFKFLLCVDTIRSSEDVIKEYKHIADEVKCQVIAVHSISNTQS